MLLFAISLLAAAPSITITGDGGKPIAIQAEDTGGIKDRPLVKSKKRLDAKYGHEFLFLDKIEATPGDAVTARCPIQGGPLRLTIYEIAKDRDGERTLRVVGTKWYADGANAEFTTTVAWHDEDVFLVTAEKTADPAKLDKHLQYMDTQGDELLVKGFGTNWDLSKLEFKLAEKKTAARGSAENGGPGATPLETVPFSKDADWLVDNLDDPQWVMSIRVVTPGS